MSKPEVEWHPFPTPVADRMYWVVTEEGRVDLKYVREETKSGSPYVRWAVYEPPDPPQNLREPGWYVARRRAWGHDEPKSPVTLRRVLESGRVLTPEGYADGVCADYDFGPAVELPEGWR